VTIGRLMAEHYKGERDHSSVLWLLLNYAAWNSVYGHARTPQARQRPTRETTIARIAPMRFSN
jgi:hypothetical protein